MSATEFISAITRALNRGDALKFRPRDYISHLLYAKDTTIPVDVHHIQTTLHIEAISVPSIKKGNKIYYDEEKLCDALEQLVNNS